jgi:heat shock protein HslJ
MTTSSRGAARIRLTLATVACVAFASCATPPPTHSALRSVAPSTADPSAVDLPAFDLSGTSWRTASLVGQPVPDETAPRLEFDWDGRPSGTGFTGCDEFGFEATIQPGRLRVGELVLNPSGCDGPGAGIERAFLTAFRGADAWAVDGDRLSLNGSGGEIILARELPPIGDPGRAVADILRVGDWQVLRAPGLVGPERLARVQFTDTMFIAAGGCGYSGEIRFGSGGALEITEVGWDTVGCAGPNDGRTTLQRLLEAVTSGRPGPDGTVVLAGPQGEVVLGR